MPMVFALGLCMLALAITTVIAAQEGRDAAALRQDSSASLLVSDSAIAEILTELSMPHNSVLLGKDYDPDSYLGPDGIPNTDDDAENGGIDEWGAILTGGNYNCQASLGYRLPDDLRVERTLGVDSKYKILAYRYNRDSQAGALLVEGIHNDIVSTVHITLAIAHDSRDFPGVMADSIVHWQGRQLTGKNGNLQFNSADDDYPNRLKGVNLDSFAETSDDQRQQYLNMVWSGGNEGFTKDSVEGQLVACDFSFYAIDGVQEESPHIPYLPKGENLGEITASQTLNGDPDGLVKEYQTSKIELNSGMSLQIDTTDSPVHLYVDGETILRGDARIVNYRRDGRPPQVGDLRLIQADAISAAMQLEGTSCIENAFIYSPEVDFRLHTTGDGCPGPSNSNVLGVVWAEDVENSAYQSSDYDPGDGNDPPVVAATSGIEVPDDVSSLTDELEAIKFPVFYRISGVTAWNDVSL